MLDLNLIQKIFTVLLAATPISLFVSIYLPKFFSSYNNKLAEIRTIFTTVSGSLTKAPIEVKSLLFDRFKAKFNRNSNTFLLIDRSTQKEMNMDKKDLQKDPSLFLLAQCATLCRYEKTRHLEEVTINFLKSCAINIKSITDDHEIISQSQVPKDQRFSSIIAINKKSKEIFAFNKGHARVILDNCTRVFIDGKKIDITPQIRHKIKKHIDKLVKNGEKVLGFAYRALPLKRLDHYSEQFTEKDLVLIGIIGLVETLNTELIPTIEALKNHGVKIFVLSGIKENKAIAVAEQLKVINPQHFESITGKMLEEIPDSKLEKILLGKEKDYIFPELETANRERIINFFIQKNQPFININKDSEYSFADVLENAQKAKTLQKDYKTIQYHAISLKIAEVILVAMALILQAPLPLTITTILCLDILINILNELSLKTDKNLSDKVENKSSLILKSISSGIIISLIYLWSLLRFGWFPGETFGDYTTGHLTSIMIVFTILALKQIIGAHQLTKGDQHLFARTSKNYYLSLTTVIIVLCLYFLTNYSFLKNSIDFDFLSKFDWQIVFFCTFLIVSIEEISKFLKRKKEHVQIIPTSI
ncbi:MAG: cation transporting ATPase C-terminal domain-containing protein [Patescibacteria group bacterium]